ncbi:serine/threonine-protein kinase PknK [Stigmatella aurantiaca]|uniref:Protein kinase domain n=1 Tax=Stigmatella aurantiaca (strain DW4/3-1) TaxID=378806 RepID=Q099D5_STIAD|nr:serine/threonine-protein kinase [Stigmatella aurantiaca]EAU68384.1 protein kinase domain [Stigmatella aurantiaca DW4/3-1]
MPVPKMPLSPILEFRGTPRFVLERRLGKGAMGVVYLARDVERGTKVALKALSRLDADGLACIKNEFRSLSDLLHPNLVTLHELVSEDGHWFLTMEVVEGVNFLAWVRGVQEVAAPDAGTLPRQNAGHLPTETLTQPALAATRTMKSAGLAATLASGRLAPAPPWPALESRLTPWCDLDRLRGALRQLVEGVSAIHAAGKLHRDLKPSNVLVTPSGRLVILDFGLALARGLSGSPAVAGTPAYMAPEQLSPNAVTPASDWYAVGTMVYEALTGQLPYQGGLSDILKAKCLRLPPPPSSRVQGIPEELERLCLACLSVSPEQRPTGEDFLRWLDGGRNRAVPTVDELPLLGREEWLAQLHQAFEVSRQGRAVTVYVSGHSGMGKSALIHHFVGELCRSSEVLVLSGRCYERESVPYKAWDSLIDALAEHLESLPPAQTQSLLGADGHALARIFPTLRRFECLGASPETLAPEVENQAESRLRAFRALKEILCELARQRPLVLCLEDLQWGDVDSARLMASLLSSSEPPQMLLLCTFRSEEEQRSGFFQTLRAFLDSGSFDLGEQRRVELGRLAPEAGARLARALLGPRGAAMGELPAVISQEAEGSPFFIGLLARHVLAREEISETALRGLSMEGVLLEYVRQLPEDARRLLNVLSVASRPLEQNVAVAAAALASDAATTLGLLRAAHLVRTHGARARDLVEPYHDRVREAVVGALGEALLRECHQCLADALEANGADPEVLAVHWEGAGDLPRARTYVLLAAERAEATLAFDHAARLYQRALSWHGTDDTQVLHLRLANALVNAGRGAEAAPLLLAAAVGRPDAEAVDLRRRAAEQFMVSGHIDEGVEVLRGVLAWARVPYPETAFRATLTLAARFAQIQLRGTDFHERSAEALSADELLPIDICHSAGRGLALVDTLRGGAFFGTALLSALECGEPRRVALGLSHYATILALQGLAGYPRAKQMLEQAQALGQRLDDPLVLGTVGICRAAVEMCLSHWRVTVEHATAASALLRNQCTGAPFEIEAGVVFSEVSLLWMGKLHELARFVDAHIRTALERGDLFAATYARMHTWYTPLAADDVTHASEAMRDSIGRWSHRGFHVMHFWALYGETQYALYAGDTAGAWERLNRTWPDMVQSNILRIQFHRIPMTLLRGSAAIAAASARPTGERKALLASAEKEAVRLDKERTGVASASASLLRACLLAAQGQSHRALEPLDAAVRGFVAADMMLHAACARRRMGQLMGGSGGRALIEAADATLRGQSIRNPARWTALYTPGFSESGAA